MVRGERHAVHDPNRLGGDHDQRIGFSVQLVGAALLPASVGLMMAQEHSRSRGD